MLPPPSFPRTRWSADAVLSPLVTPHARRLRTAARSASIAWELAALNRSWKEVDVPCVCLCVLAKADELAPPRLDDYSINAIVWTAYEMAKEAAPRRLTLPPYEVVFDFVSKALNIMVLSPAEAGGITLTLGDVELEDEKTKQGSSGLTRSEKLAATVLRCTALMADVGSASDDDNDDSDTASDTSPDWNTSIKSISTAVWSASDTASDKASVGGTTAVNSPTPLPGLRFTNKKRPYTWPMLEAYTGTVPLLTATRPTPSPTPLTVATSLPSCDVLEPGRLQVPGCGVPYDELNADDADDDGNDESDLGAHSQSAPSDSDSASSDSEVLCHPDCLDPFNCLYDESESWEGYLPDGTVVELAEVVDSSGDNIEAYKLDDLLDMDEADAFEDVINVDGVGDPEDLIDMSEINALVGVIDAEALPDMDDLLANLHAEAEDATDDSEEDSFEYDAPDACAP